ncbi:MAG: hypothetical protein ABR521_12735 [Gaiellaceae bacterium]
MQGQAGDPRRDFEKRRTRGTKRADVIVGLGGDDRISGLGGRDIICGGPGRDTIDGGAGARHARR